MPYFLLNDLEPVKSCFPHEAIVKKGLHRVFRMQSGMRVSRTLELAKGKFEDEEGNIFRKYPIVDNSDLATPLPKIRITGRNIVGQRGRNAQGNAQPSSRQSPGSIAKLTKFSTHGRLGTYNKHTCHKFPPSSIVET